MSKERFLGGDTLDLQFDSTVFGQTVLDWIFSRILSHLAVEFTTFVFAHVAPSWRRPLFDRKAYWKIVIKGTFVDHANIDFLWPRYCNPTTFTASITKRVALSFKNAPVICTVDGQLKWFFA